MDEFNFQKNNLLEKFDKYIIASQTDTKGNIIYASEAYCHISGYTKEELIGQPHNIVRHPDMPKDIFKDLWLTIKSGNKWVGEIKNLRKDGSYYWVKAYIEPNIINGQICGYYAIRKDITAQKELEKLNNSLEYEVQKRTKQINEQLFKDPLTSLGNYNSLNEDIKDYSDDFIVLFLINIDDFQSINNLYGFDVGNDVLKQFAKFLKDLDLFGNYKFYRIYADEFALYDLADFNYIDRYYEDLEELKRLIKKEKFYISSIDNYIEISVTIGVSIGQEEPISTVDMALRHAKRNKLWFQTYNTTLDLTNCLENAIKVNKQIDNAIDENKVYPVFQPIVNKNKEIIKYEVLMRIRGTDDSNNDIEITPIHFLDEAIKTKRYNYLAQIIFKETFSKMRDSDKQFSINISYDDIYNFTLINDLEKHILKNKNLASRLVIEILETSAIRNFEIMDEFLSKFRNYGVKIAIDDFGMGHSNLSHVLYIKPDFLKIDGEFIKNIHTSKESFAMVKSIVAFCHELDIKVIAEYVHSEEVFEILYKLGVDEFQGYYFYAPLKDI